MTYQKNLHSGFTLLDGEDITLGQGSAVKGLLNRPENLFDNVGTGITDMATVPDLTDFFDPKDVLLVEATLRIPNKPTTAAIDVWWGTTAAPLHAGILGYTYAIGESGVINFRLSFYRDQTDVTRFAHTTVFSKDEGVSSQTDIHFGTVTYKPWDYAGTGPLILRSDSTVLAEQVLMYGFSYSIIKSGA